MWVLKEDNGYYPKDADDVGEKRRRVGCVFDRISAPVERSANPRGRAARNNILAWNCRGLRLNSTVGELRDLI